ncbi:MAG: PGF-pre-PGF domain-containing protein, partial [Candidatus Aenigmatarchaeota archaeon]
SNNNSLSNLLIDKDDWDSVLFEDSHENNVSNTEIFTGGWYGLNLENSSKNKLDNLYIFSRAWDGIYLNNADRNIINNTYSESTGWWGIGLKNSDGNNITNFNTTCTGWGGMEIDNSNNNTIKNSRFFNNETNQRAIRFGNFSVNNTIYNNFFNVTYPIDYKPTENNTWNATKQNKENIMKGGNIGGNFWAAPDGTGFSENCLDDDLDYICDTPKTINDKNVDWAPLSNLASVEFPRVVHGPSPPNNFSTEGNVTFQMRCYSNETLNNMQLLGNWYDGWDIVGFKLSPKNNSLWNVTVENIPEGTWKWMGSCNDSTKNSDWTDYNRTFEVDRSPPKITIENPEEKTYETSQIEFDIVIDEEVDKCWWSPNENDENRTLTELSDTITLNEGSYNLSVYCNDTLSHVGSNKSISFSVEIDDGNTGGGEEDDENGGGHMPAPPQPPNPPEGQEDQFRKRWNMVNRGATVMMEINKTDIGVESIDLSVKNRANNVEISVSREREEEGNIKTEVSKKVYQYLKIDSKNLRDEDINSTKIRFSVNRSWIRKRKVNEDHVYLYRYHEDEWEKLNTTKISETKTKIKYESTTPGFSYFAVAEDDKICPFECCVNSSYYDEKACQKGFRCKNYKCIEIEEENPEDKQNQEEERVNKKNLPIIFSVPLLIMIFVILYLLRGREIF